MSRRKAREVALQALFQLDYNQAEPQEALQHVLSEYEALADGVTEYAEKLVAGTRENLAAIDQLISQSAHDWTVDRMAGVDRNILRMALFEHQFMGEEVPHGVIINEAVELAKRYGSADSKRFVNGLLGTLLEGKNS